MLEGRGTRSQVTRLNRLVDMEDTLRSHPAYAAAAIATANVRVGRPKGSNSNGASPGIYTDA